MTRTNLMKGLPVHGYAEQPAESVNVVNVHKEMEERLLRRCDHLKQFPEFDQRWLSIAITHFQEGFMALNRAIFKPQRIMLPEDASDENESSG